ncbi:MAG: hypothetical protein OHK0048_07120 [Rhodoferax sp.]
MQGSRRWDWVVRGLAVGLALALLARPAWLSDWALHVVGQCAVAVVACLGYQILLGQTGVLSLGQGLYAGLGAYAAICALRVPALMQVLPVAMLPLVGAAAGAGTGLVLGRLCARGRGVAPAMITLALAELAWALALMLPQLSGGDAGLSANRDWPNQPLGWQWGPPHAATLLVLAWAGLAWVVVGYAGRTPLWRLLGAVRDNPLRAAALGYDPIRLRWLGFVMAGGLAGLSGALGAILSERVSPESLAWDKSAAVLMFSVLGGTTSRTGALIGGILMATSALVLPLSTPAWPLYLGLGFVLCVALLPQGLVSLAAPAQRQRLRSLWQHGTGQRALWLVSLALWGLAGALALVSIEDFYALQRSSELRETLLKKEQNTLFIQCMASALAAWSARSTWRRLGPKTAGGGF